MKPAFTEADYRYARYTYNRLKHEYGKRMTTSQVAKELGLEHYQTSQRLNQNGFKQFQPGYYHVDDVTAYMTRWHRDKLRKILRNTIKTPLKEA